MGGAVEDGCDRRPSIRSHNFLATFAGPSHAVAHGRLSAIRLARRIAADARRRAHCVRDKAAELLRARSLRLQKSAAALPRALTVRTVEDLLKDIHAELAGEVEATEGGEASAEGTRGGGNAQQQQANTTIVAIGGELGDGEEASGGVGSSALREGEGGAVGGGEGGVGGPIAGRGEGGGGGEGVQAGGADGRLGSVGANGSSADVAHDFKATAVAATGRAERGDAGATRWALHPHAGTAGQAGQAGQAWQTVQAGQAGQAGQADMTSLHCHKNQLIRRGGGEEGGAPMEKRQKRMIKNRESAALSRARKQVGCSAVRGLAEWFGVGGPEWEAQSDHVGSGVRMALSLSSLRAASLSVLSPTPPWCPPNPPPRSGVHSGAGGKSGAAVGRERAAAHTAAAAPGPCANGESRSVH
ncbi:unnamed protein product [Closterium sp. Yama58-4]|nr:unnamed protein product [Closterium sp. Yama58-4]